MSHYKPYPAYKDSGVEWLGRVPEHWEQVPLKWIFDCLDGMRVPLNAEQRAEIPGETPYWGSGGVVGHISKYIFEEDLVLLGEDGAPFFDKDRPVAYEITGKSWINNHIHVLRSIRDVPNSWLVHYLNTVEYRLYIDGSTRDKLTQEDMKSIVLLVPPKDEALQAQKNLDRETTRIDALIAKKTRFIELVSEKIVTLACDCLEMPEEEWIRLAHVADVIRRPVAQESGETYTKLGLLNRGRGIFKKNESDQEDMGDSDFYWVERGDLVLSGQFSWEGAIAVATDEHMGCVVSHRFPIIRGRVGKVLTEYLFALLMSEHGDFMLNDCSRGSAGRNKPLNMNLLLKWKIPVPSIEYQQQIAKLVWLRERMKKANERSITLLKERRSALITAAVTGQIDLRD